MGDRGIVCLRNPFIEPRTVTFKPDTGKPCMARIVYPRHETLPRGSGVQLRLGAYETVILQFDPVPEEPALAGIPADLHIVRAPAVRHYPRPLQELPQGQGAFYSLDLPTGHDAVVVSLDFPGTGQLETSWWLCAESPMAEGELELEFGDALPALPVEPLPLPVSMVTRHETLSVGERFP